MDTRRTRRSHLTASTMTDDTHSLSRLVDLPTELIYYIFAFLPARTLVKFREVCVKWKQIIDDILKNEVVWWNHCKEDFKSVYSSVRRKARPGTTCYDIYKSLTLWRQLEFTEEVVDEFASASTVQEEILSFEILRDGIVGVRTKSGIIYHDIQNQQLANRDPINGQYLKYAENDEVVILLNSLLHLYIVRKVTHHPRDKVQKCIDNIKLFMLLNDKVYLVNLKDEIFECDLASKNLDLMCIHWSGDNILCLGHVDEQVYVMTYTRSIYVVDSNSYIFTCSLNGTMNLLHLLNKYNFMEQMEWRQYYHWLFLLNLKLPEDPLRFISTVKSYGDVYFVGTEWGLLRIYYAPYINKKLDLYNSKAVKEFNFSKPDCPVLSNSCIIQIDISETQHGHIVLVGMPKKIAIINFKHNFEATTSVAVLPYKGAKKKLKIKRCDSN